MSENSSSQHGQPIARLPVAWLKPRPDGYRTPIWRWLLLPASALMLRYYGGVWISGELQLSPTALRFVQGGMIKASRNQTQDWSLTLGDITSLSVERGIASQTLEITHRTGTEKVMAARPDEFVQAFKQARAGLGAPIDTSSDR